MDIKVRSQRLQILGRSLVLRCLQSAPVVSTENHVGDQPATIRYLEH